MRPKVIMIYTQPEAEVTSVHERNPGMAVGVVGMA